jgi:hypothetical protein
MMDHASRDIALAEQLRGSLANADRGDTLTRDLYANFATRAKLCWLKC